MAEPKVIEWLTGWDRNVDPQRQQSYVEEELTRLAREGQPLLYAALTTALASQQDIAIRELRKLRPTVYLRLAPGVTPPPTDAQGRSLSTDDQGKALVAKVGNRGNMAYADIKAADESGETERYKSSNRGALFRSAKGGYDQKRVTFTPQSFSLDDAIVILRQWGHGIRDAEHRFYRRGTKDERTGDVNWQMQDRWLVEEVPQDDYGQPILPESKTTAPAAKSSKAA